MDVLLNQGLVLVLYTQLVARHPVLVEDTLALGLDLLRALQSTDGGRHKISVVTDRDVATLLELEGRVLYFFFLILKSRKTFDVNFGCPSNGQSSSCILPSFKNDK